MSLQEDPSAEEDRFAHQVRRICEEYGYELDRITWSDEGVLRWFRSEPDRHINFSIPEFLAFLEPHLVEELFSKCMHFMVTGEKPKYSDELIGETKELMAAYRERKA